MKKLFQTNVLQVKTFVDINITDIIKLLSQFNKLIKRF